MATKTYQKFEELKTQAKNSDLFAVAQSLGMNIDRGGTAEWQGHSSFWLDRKKNRFQWYGKDVYGDPIDLVSVVKFGATSQDEIQKHFRESVAYLTNTEVPKFDLNKVPKQVPFSYYLSDLPQLNEEGRRYLRDARGISDETIDYFEEAGALTQSTWRSQGEDGSAFEEPVLVFKHLDQSGKMIGGSVQGIRFYQEHVKDHPSGHLKRVIKNSGSYSGIGLNIGQPERIVTAEAPMDLMSYYELHKNQLKNVRLIASDGYKPQVISRGVAEIFGKKDMSVSDKEQFMKTFDELTLNMKKPPENLITFAYDNDKAGRGFIEKFHATYPNSENYSRADLPPLNEGKDKNDWNDQLKAQKAPEQSQGTEIVKGEVLTESRFIDQQHGKEKAPDRGQEPNNAGGELLNRNSSSLGEKSPGTAPKPAQQAEPDFPTNALLNFSIREGEKSKQIHKRSYHVATSSDLIRLNRYATSIQSVATWYSRELAGSQVNYVYQINGKLEALKVNFEKEHFSHLVGISPVYDNQHSGIAARFLDEIVQGKGKFDNLLVSNGFRDKLQVLPLLPEFVESKSFLFNDLSEIEKFGRLNVESAIRTEDEDLLLAFRTLDGETFPASMLKLNSNLNQQLKDKSQDMAIIAVVRERDGKFEQLSLNNELIEGKEQDFQGLLESALSKVKDAAVVVEQPQPLKADDAIIEAFAQENNLSAEVKQFLQAYTSAPLRERDELFTAAARNNIIESSFIDDFYRYRSDHMEKFEAKNSPEFEEPKLKSETSLSDIIKSKDNKVLGKYMKDGVKEYLKSDTYKKYLDIVSKLHQYSSKNIRLLFAQNPDISMVASLKSWNKNFERRINKGEKALYVYAPQTVKIKDKDGKILKNKDGKDQTQTFFKLVPVYDVAQTNGKEIPQPVYRLEGEVKNYGKIYEALTQTTNAQIGFMDITTGANGFYKPMEDIIRIQKGMSQEQTIKTVIHEIAHSNLHNLDKRKLHDYTTEEKELQAESVAYVVSNHLGIDTSQYSFGYLANWSSDKEQLEKLSASMTIVQEEANRMIAKVDKLLIQTQNKVVEKDNLDMKLDKALERQKEDQQSKKQETTQNLINQNQKISQRR